MDVELAELHNKLLGAGSALIDTVVSLVVGLLGRAIVSSTKVGNVRAVTCRMK